MKTITRKGTDKKGNNITIHQVMDFTIEGEVEMIAGDVIVNGVTKNPSKESKYTFGWIRKNARKFPITSVK